MYYAAVILSELGSSMHLTGHALEAFHAPAAAVHTPATAAARRQSLVHYVVPVGNTGGTKKSQGKKAQIRAKPCTRKNGQSTSVTLHVQARSLSLAVSISAYHVQARARSLSSATLQLERGLVRLSQSQQQLCISSDTTIPVSGARLTAVVCNTAVDSLSKPQ